MTATASRRHVIAGTLAACWLGPARAADAAEQIAITPELIAAAEKEGTLTLQYTSPLVTMQGLVADFGKAFPKVTVNLERKPGTAGAEAILEETAAGVTRVDLYQGSDVGMNAELRDKGVFAAVEPANIADYHPTARIMAPYLYYQVLERTVVAYNSKFVTDEEARKLRSWTGILEPEFKGRIAISEPSVGVALGPLLYVMNAPGMGEAFLRKLRDQQPRIYLTTAQMRDAVVSGQRPISWGADWEAVILLEVDAGAPIRFVYPDPTPEFTVSGWGVLKQAPHPHAARLFLAWKMSREGALDEQAPYSMERSMMANLPETRAAFQAVQKQPWYAPPGKTWAPDLQDWISNGGKYQETWEKIMKHGG